MCLYMLFVYIHGGFYLFSHMKNYEEGPLMYQSTDFLEGCFLQHFLANLLYHDQH